jgi:hypothetical protein
MCARATCPRCHKPSFVGCGRHVEQILGDVPRDQRCHCRDDKATDATPRDERPIWKRLFGG